MRSIRPVIRTDRARAVKKMLPRAEDAGAAHRHPRLAGVQGGHTGLSRLTSTMTLLVRVALIATAALAGATGAPALSGGAEARAAGRVDGISDQSMPAWGDGGAALAAGLFARPPAEGSRLTLARYVVQWDALAQPSDGPDPHGDYRERFEAWLADVAGGRPGRAASRSRATTAGGRARAPTTRLPCGRSSSARPRAGRRSAGWSRGTSPTARVAESAARGGAARERGRARVRGATAARCSRAASKTRAARRRMSASTSARSTSAPAPGRSIAYVSVAAPQRPHAARAPRRASRRRPAGSCGSPRSARSTAAADACSAKRARPPTPATCSTA